MGQGILYGGSVVSISVVRARAMQELYSGQHEPGMGVLAQHKKRTEAHQAIDDLQVAVTGRVFGNSSDLSSSRGRVRERNGPRLTHQRSDTVSIFTIDGHRASAGFQQNLDRLRRVHPRGEPQRSNPVHRLLRGVQRVQRYVAVFHEHPEDVQPVRRHK